MIDNTYGPSKNNYVSEGPYLIIYVVQRPNVLCIQPSGLIFSSYVSHQTCIIGSADAVRWKLEPATHW